MAVTYRLYYRFEPHDPLTLRTPGQQTELNLNPQTGCETDSTQGPRHAYMCTIKCGLSPAYKMLPAVLKTQGYATHALGKWQCDPQPMRILAAWGPQGQGGQNDGSKVSR